MRTPGYTRRTVALSSSQRDLYAVGCEHATMAGTEGCETGRWRESQKGGLSSDWGLQLNPMKSESLVIANHQRRGEYVPGPCTHRPSRHERQQHPKPVAYPGREAAVEGGASDWDENATR